MTQAPEENSRAVADDSAEPGTTTGVQHRQFPCKSCGASLSFLPGSTTLKCPHCGTENQIIGTGQVVEDKDYLAELEQLEGKADSFEPMEIHCGSCGAMTTLPDAVVAIECPFCSNPIVGTAQSKRLIKPQAVLPFALNRQQAISKFEQWLASLWLAPNDLKTRAVSESRFAGVYLPFWLYDTSCTSRYTGERGDDYWTTESYTDSNGKRQTRRVKRTRWSYVSGTVGSKFDDVLVRGSISLPTELVENLEPWDLNAMVPYQDEFITGFRAEAYRVPIKQGFEMAKQIIAPKIRSQICSDIGGDHQRIHTVNTSYFGIKFQHILLPVWASSFHYNGMLYPFLVNARTGEVQGKRPWSAWKITFLVMAISTLIAIVALAIHYS